jgi:hypothetical protein
LSELGKADQLDTHPHKYEYPLLDSPLDFIRQR